MHLVHPSPAQQLMPTPMNTPRPGQSLRAGMRDGGLLRCATELRFNVYCLEKRYLCAESYPGGIETDDYDLNAAHFHAFEAEGQLAGYVRLVRPSSCGKFPFQDFFVNKEIESRVPPPEQCAEVSRLILSQSYRRIRTLERQHGIAEPYGSRSTYLAAEQFRIKVFQNLYYQMVAYSARNGINYWYAAMEAPLAKLTSGLGIRFEPIGEAFEYYGLVRPYLAKVI